MVGDGWLDGHSRPVRLRGVARKEVPLTEGRAVTAPEAFEEFTWDQQVVISMKALPEVKVEEETPDWESPDLWIKAGAWEFHADQPLTWDQIKGAIAHRLWFDDKEKV